MNREDIMANNNAASEKVVTKYDRKMQKRKEEERKEAKRRYITKWVCIAVLACIILGSGTATGIKLNSIYKDYIEVDNDKISQIEFDFYYGIAKTKSLNTTLYGSMTYGDYYSSYMGYKTSQSDKSQEYSTDYTWYDFFANTAVSTIKETKALLEDADANGFTYDNEDADYDEFIGKLKDAANEADTSYSDYLKQMFGKRATEKRVKEFLKDYLKSTAYQEKLTETLAASDSEVSAYYEDNKDTYDKFEYRMVTETKKSNIEEACADWIASSDRKEGDLTVIEDDDNTCFYIVYYISRSYDGSDDDAIKSTLLNQKYSEYIKKYTDEYSVNVIFDLDGTILDSTQVWAKVDMDFLGRRGIPVSKEYMQEIKTHTFESGSVYTKEKYNLPESTEEIMKEWYDAACKAYTDKVVLKPYAKTFIEQMHNNGLKIVSATSSDRALFEPCLRRNGIYGFFDAFTQTNEVVRGKKFPDVYMKAAGKAGCSVNECIVFEDVLSAAQGAKSGGFTVVAVYDEASADDWPDICRIADYNIRSYSELI